MDWELSSVRIHGWIKKKYVESHIVLYVLYVYLCMHACFMYATCIHIHMYTHAAYKCIQQTHTNTHTLSIRVEKIGHAWNARSHDTWLQRCMCITCFYANTCAARITRATATKRTRAFFVLIFRSLMLRWPTDLNMRKGHTYIVFQEKEKHIPIAVFMRRSSSSRERVTLYSITFQTYTVRF